MTGCQKTNSYERNSTRIESWGRPKLRMYRWIRMQLDTFETRFQSKYSMLSDPKFSAIRISLLRKWIPESN